MYMTYTSTTTGITSNLIYPDKFACPTCKYRLPCGMCELNRQYCMPIGYKLTCDVNKDDFEINWGEHTTKVDCNA